MGRNRKSRYTYSYARAPSPPHQYTPAPAPVLEWLIETRAASRPASPASLRAAEYPDLPPGGTTDWGSPEPEVPACLRLPSEHPVSPSVTERTCRSNRSCRAPSERPVSPEVTERTRRSNWSCRAPSQAGVACELVAEPVYSFDGPEVPCAEEEVAGEEPPSACEALALEVAWEEPKAAVTEAAFEVPEAFFDPSADVLLKSSDDVLFKVHKALLTIGSTYFKAAFHHQQAGPDDLGSTANPVFWPECASTVTALLYRLYPIVKPDIDNVDDLIALTTAAVKWGMPAVLVDLQALLLKPRFLDSRPLAIYKVACRLNLIDMKRCSARRLVELYDPFDAALRPDAAELSALDFIALYELRQKRIAYTLQLLQSHVYFYSQHRCQVVISHEVLRSRLSKNPSASIFATIPDISGTVEEHGYGCKDRDCANSWSRLNKLKEDLANADRFLGDETYL
ncbi:hypothetical protein CALVIDRAFT_565043 [Calocera viscosa TUFC12733]|uniref:BTB domain-containing protein n=1 Tax=Calocera viscosa (strain TUFC12733) TaxID=1330018 RepID=A0A167L2U0_CALVF|nr:hypothetical protein CALVIDRAFT_565043 [Calocera viscosa TUFC12733]